METKKVVTGAAAAAVATAVTVGGVVGTKTDIDGTYGIVTDSPYRSQITVTVPEEFTPDIVVLKLNGMEVGKTLLPDGKISTYPSVVSDTSRLSLDMYVRGDKAAEAEFDENGVLSIKASKKYVEEAAEDEE